MAEKPEEGFLGRWAQRKQEVRKQEARKEAAREPEPDIAPDAPPEVDFEQMSEAEVLEHLGLPDPDDLGLGADFKQFLGQAVPKQIRQRALRRLWTSNPVLANLDGLNDYEQDFTAAATVVENLKTSYVVGEGFVKRVTEVVDEMTDRVMAEAAPDLPEQQPLSSVRLDGQAVGREPPKGTDPAPEGVPVEDDDEEEIAAIPVPRRMRFDTDSG